MRRPRGLGCRAARPDALVVAAYGLILPPWLLELPRLGCFEHPRLVAAEVARRRADPARHPGR